MALSYFIQLKLLKGASTSDINLSETDYQNIADRVWDQVIAGSLRARDIMEMFPSMLAVNTENNQISKLNKKMLDELSKIILTYQRN